MDAAKTIAVSSYRLVLGDWPEVYSSKSQAQYSGHGEQFTTTDMYTDGDLMRRKGDVLEGMYAQGRMTLALERTQCVESYGIKNLGAEIGIQSGQKQPTPVLSDEDDV
jgi:hypothetical protein